jgi:HEAT repeat protein
MAKDLPMKMHRLPYDATTIAFRCTRFSQLGWAIILCLCVSACAGVQAPEGEREMTQFVPVNTEDSSADEHLVVHVDKKMADGSTQKIEADGWYFDYGAAKGEDSVGEDSVGEDSVGEDSVGDDKDRGGYLWKHEIISKLLVTPSEESKSLLRKATNSSKRIIAANANIGLARIDGVKYLKPLHEITKELLLPINVRRAAIETLFSLKGDQALQKVQQQTVQELQKPGATYVPELHIEVLQHYGKVATAEQYKALISTGLDTRNDSVRKAALQAIVKRPAPAQPWGLIDSDDPGVRAAVLDLFDKNNSANEHERFKLFRQLGDSTLEVRLAAIRAVGRGGSESDLKNLRSMYAVEPERIQTEILRALTTAGDLDFVFQQIDAEQWRVRMALAEALESDVNAEHWREAKRLLNDESGEVRLRTIAAIANWNPKIMGDLLFDVASNDTTHRSRQAATRAIAIRVMPADKVASFFSTRNEKIALAELKTLWGSKIKPKALSAQNANARVSNAEQVDDVQSKLSHHHAFERSQGCKFLQANPDPRQLKRLLELTSDTDAMVSQAALRAMGTNGGAEHLDYLSSRLSDKDHLTRVAAAFALTKLGSSRGVAALNRLVRDKEPAVQLATLNAMGEMQNPLFAAAVLPMLDGPKEIQDAVLRVLPDIVGQETANGVSSPKVPMALQIERWRKWFRTGGKWATGAGENVANQPNSTRKTGNYR